jgi:predicted ribosomally synthesized peptide with SipW-like signal peptide
VRKHVAPSRRRTFTRVRAVLAGALVLGVGASMTLASWTDSEYAAGTFTASTFRLESSTATSTWKDSTSPADASLMIDATSMSPGASQYAWVNIRTTAASTVGGTIALASSTSSGTLVPVLEYKAVRTTAVDTTCDAAAFSGSPAFVAGSSSAYLPAASVPGSPVASAVTPSSRELRYCFEVRIQPGASNTYQGGTGTVTWLFTGTSD